MNRSKEKDDGDESGSKRKAPDSALLSSSAATEPTGESDRPQKKQAALSPPLVTSSKAEVVSSDGTTDAKPEATSSSAAAASADESTDELILEWENYEDGDESRLSISADEAIAQGISLGETSAAEKNEKGEWEERYYTLKLVNKRKGADNNEMAELNFVWWADSSHAHLMNFNQKSKWKMK